MQTDNYIDIRIVGTKGNDSLTKDNFDVDELAVLLDIIKDLLYPNRNKKERPVISYTVQDGSVINRFKTTGQAVAIFSTVITMVLSQNSIDNLELQTAKAIEKIQRTSICSNYTYEFSTSLDSRSKLTVSPQTNFHITEDLWVDAELYFYGTLTNAGGKDKANIHIDTKEAGTLIVQTDKSFLMEEEQNLLYRQYGVRVKGKQNLRTGELDNTNLKLIELIDYKPKYDEGYLNSLIEKVGNKFSGINVDSWISQMRGAYE